MRYEGRKDRVSFVGTAACFVLSTIFTAAAFVQALSTFNQAISVGNIYRASEVVLLYSIFTLMVFGTSVFFVARLGDIKRHSDRGIPEQSDLEDTYREDASPEPLLILVPSYKEEREIIFQTMMSAALVEYPERTIVLLIDDPPYPNDRTDAERLAVARALPLELTSLFDACARRFIQAEVDYHLRRSKPHFIPVAEVNLLARLYHDAADWLDAQAQAFKSRESITHTDRLFVREILELPADAHRKRAAELAAATPSASRVAREYRRLASLFRVSIGSFERKRYVNLSHAPNKAMNLNSYIGLLGGHYREQIRSDGLHLESAAVPNTTLSFPDIEFIGSVDADSLITSDYALRLMQVMHQPGNERIAVAQSPYTAVHGTPIALERAAAASTDAQFFNHHGMAYFGSSFWVGASALMRRSALKDIAVPASERGFPVTIFIHDKILIEDAAATIDLLNKNWRVYHDLKRLSYSATPADFGALIIQRRRWANGGLLILPKLLRHMVQRPCSLRKTLASLVRIPTLTSAAISGIGMPILLLYPFEDEVISLWLSAAALPYYLLYGQDMVRAGYGWRDLPRVYALNLLLVPVQLGGTIQSVRQAISGQPVPFRRTPKVAGRTAAAPIYLLGILALTIYALLCGVLDAVWDNRRHLLFDVFNVVIMLYAVLRFVGVRELKEDLWIGLSTSLAQLRTAAAAYGRTSIRVVRRLSPLSFLITRPAGVPLGVSNPPNRYHSLERRQP